jgi:DNA repair protein RadC
MGRRIHWGVLDFTHTDTIYVRKLKTTTLTLHVKPIVYNAYTIRTIGGPVEIESLLRSIFEQYDADQEHLVMLILSVSHDVTGFKLVASGTENSVEGSRKVIFRHALLLGASAIILAHNHPNGPLRPSESDIKMTRYLLEASRYLSISVLDHFIVGPGPNFTCASMKEQLPNLFDVKPLEEDEG